MQLYGSGVWSVGFGAWILATVVIIARFRRPRSKTDPLIEPLLLEVRTNILQLSEKVALLDQHTDAYFQTLTEAGFPHLQDLLRAVEMAAATIEKLARNGKLKESASVARWILDQTLPAPEPSTLPEFVQQTVQNWRENSRTLLTACTNALSETAQQNSDVGLERTRKRQPTMMNVKALRDAEDAS